MNMMSYEPWNGPGTTPRNLRQLHDEMNRLFGNVFEASHEDGSSVVTSRWSPAVDVLEEDDQLAGIVEALPAGKPVPVLVERDHHPLFLALTIPTA